MNEPTINVLALIKGREKYVFLFGSSRSEIGEILRQFGRWASSPELSFTWYDAAVLSQRAREEFPPCCESRF